MALRLTSNLLYGVTLIYRQKTDYLNNDTAAIKTKVQKDLFNQGSNKHLLIKPNTDFLKPIGASSSDAFTNNQNQVLLNDDPSFNVANGLLPPLTGLSFLSEVQFNDQNMESRRKIEIRKADIANNTASIIHSIIVDPEDGNPMFGRGLVGDDELDADNAEFAFDEDGLLFSLRDEENVNANNQLTPQPMNDFNVDMDMDMGMDFEFDAPPIGQDTNEEGVNADDNNLELNPLDQILEEINNSDNAQPETIAAEVTKKQRKKRTRNEFNVIVIDASIGLQTEDLRGFRDSYVERMTNKTKKPKITLPSVTQLLHDSSFYIPIFEEDHVRRGRSRHRPILDHEEDEEDFVDSLLRNRRSSGSIEVGRRGSSSTRRNSRASISGINLPFPGDDETTHYNDGGGDDFYDLDFGDILPIGGDRSAEERSTKKRSSSTGTLTRFEPVQEDAEMDFDMDFQEDFDKIPITRGGAKHHNSENDFNSAKSTTDEIETQHGRKTLKFLKFIETRFIEEESRELSFAEILNNQNRSITVKSFYEILQLATLNQIGISVQESIEDKMKILDPYEIMIQLRR